MNLKWVLFCALSATMSAAFGDAPEPVNAERFNTRNGVVRVGEIGPAFQHNALLVDGKRIFVGPSDGILLWRDYRVGTVRYGV